MEELSLYLMMNNILAMDNVNVHIINLQYVNTYTINMDEIKL